MLTLKIREQDVIVSNPQKFVKGTVGAKCKVVFDPYWKDYNRTIVFKPSAKFRGGPIPIYIPEMETELTIPWEVTEKVGSFKIGAYGTTDELTTPTLWCEPIMVVDGTDTTGTAPKDPSPSVYNQLIDIANEAVSVAQSVRDDADAGKFDGEKGEKGDKGDPGSGGTVEADQTYDPTSINAQSGKAVSEALQGYVPTRESNGHTDQAYVISSLGINMLVEIEDPSMNLDGGNDFGWSIARRNLYGNLLTRTPVDDLDCTNKAYVDGLVGDIETLLGGI